MKKKILLTVAIVVLVISVLTACELIPGKDDVYSSLNKMARMEYDVVKLEVQTTYNNVTLVNKYSAYYGANGTLINYSVERLATINSDSAEGFIVPDKMIETKTGSATIKDGKIVNQSGDSVTIPTTMSALAIHFDKVYFDDPNTYDESGTHVFESKVSDAKGFTGNSTFEGKDMRVSVRYGEKLKTVIIDYTSKNGAAVKAIYTFN